MVSNGPRLSVKETLAKSSVPLSLHENLLVLTFCCAMLKVSRCMTVHKKVTKKENGDSGGGGEGEGISWE